MVPPRARQEREDPAEHDLSRDAVDTPRGLLPVLTLLLALGILLRLPVLALPLEGEGAALATRAGRMGAEQGWTIEAVRHRGPLLPLVLAVPIASGATPTGALRGLDVLLGAALAPLACTLALALGLGARSARWAGLLLAVHPMLALGAGGALAGTGSLAAFLLLSALLALVGGGPVRRRLGAGLLLLLPLADPACAAYVPFLLGVWLVREPSRRWAVAGLLLTLGALGATPFPAPGADPAVGSRLLAFALQWLPIALLLGLLPFVPIGLRRVWHRGGAFPRAWLAGAGLHVLLLVLLPTTPGVAIGWGGLAAGAPLVPLAALVGVAGVEGFGRRRALLRGLLGVATAASLFLVIGPLETWLLPGATPPAGRLWRLGRVVAEADAAAGPDGWLAFDTSPPLDAYETERLGDLVPGRVAGPLDALPLGDLDGDLAILTRHRPEVLDVVTLGGRGIFRQEAVLRLGPWLVLRATRP